MTSGLRAARSALAVSASATQPPAAAVASSQSRYSRVNGPAFQPASSRAILIPLTTVSVWALALPVRGMLDTILMTLLSAASPELQPDSVASSGAAAQATRANPSRERLDM